MRRRVLADTNILISAFLFPGSVPDRALQHILTRDHLVLTEWILNEFARVVARNWPNRADAGRAFLEAIDHDLAAPTETALRISDPGDQPILEAAIGGSVDILVTGDKRFFSLGLHRPRILSAREFLELPPTVT